MTLMGERYDLSPDFDGTARLFPLPDFALFPGVTAPLHVFESRYREMFEDAIGGDRLIAMATLLPGFEYDYYSRGPIAPTVCIGRIVEHERTEKGTYVFNLIGLRRARVLDEIEPVRSFRRANVQLIEDIIVGDETEKREIGLTLSRQLQAMFPATAELTAFFEDGALTLSAFTDIVAFHLPLDNEIKLALLAEPDPLPRARTLVGELPNLDQ